jgi:uncharacterized protein with HEPN domain
MQREPCTYLWDIQFAAGHVLDFVRGVDFSRYESDILLRSAIERQLQNVGEALAQLARADRILAQRLPTHAEVIAFRNVLVYGYAVIDHKIVWRVIAEDLPVLKDRAEALLAEGGGVPTP